MTDVVIETARGTVQGHVHEDFTSVRDAFVQNFDERGEVGASVSLSVEGETVVDLWGGHFDLEGTRPWEEDTVSLVFSVTKAATALCAHLLIERGELDLHGLVTDYWPEFGQAGKERTTVAMMLSHSVGLPAFREPVKEGGLYDWDYACDLLARQEPFWEPGTRNGYHMISFGWTVGELVRRISGKSLGTFFRDEFAVPLGLDFWIGLPEELEPRVSHMLPYAPGPDFVMTEFTNALLNEPGSISALSLTNTGGYSLGTPDSREAHAAEIGGGGGISNARSLAKLFTPLANGGGDYFSADSIRRMSRIAAATQYDATLLIPSRFAYGFMRSMDNRGRAHGDGDSVLLGDAAFGHVGAGGHLAFADPDCHLAFGYTMNQMGQGLLLNPRGQGVVDAAYEALGYRTNAPGVWVR
ncbi:MAG: serine hydrolase domain-containing protein [Pseudomonadales bacterium]|jgi:CubicO group peptidase (beta-lactamase class C family)|nr:serine hydrolase domain-containing protein [Pseudomonadales bacterium]